MEKQSEESSKSIQPLQSLSDRSEKPETGKEEQQSIDSLVSKEFVLRHTFQNVSKTDEKRKDGPFEEFFGVKWCLAICKKDDEVSVEMHCLHRGNGKWSITTDFELKTVHITGRNYSEQMEHCFEKTEGYGWKMDWKKLEEYVSVYDELTVEAYVNIQKMTGIYKKNLKFFDKSSETDIVLIAQNKKFWVSKDYLSTNSTYFESMFSGKFEESQKSEVILDGIDANDFQKFLEVFHGDSRAIDEYTVEGILLIADMYDAQNVIRKCDEFLQEKSNKSLKKRLEIAGRYNSEQLKKTCLTDMKTIKEVQTASSNDIRDMDPSNLAILLKESLSFN